MPRWQRLADVTMRKQGNYKKEAIWEFGHSIREPEEDISILVFLSLSVGEVSFDLLKNSQS